MGFFVTRLPLWYYEEDTTIFAAQFKGVNTLTTWKQAKRRSRFQWQLAHRYGPGPKLHLRTGWHNPHSAYFSIKPESSTIQITSAMKQHQRLLIQITLAAAAFLIIACLETAWWASIAILTLLIHEFGHLIALKRYGIKTQGIFLIPEVGAVVIAPLDTFHSRSREANIALAGPAVGLAGAVIGQYLYHATGRQWFAAFVVISASLNLLNLCPVLPLDGGRVWRALLFSCNSRVGYAYLCVGLFVGPYILHHLSLPIGFLIISILACVGYWLWEKSEGRAIAPMNRRQKIAVALGYITTMIGLIAVIVWVVITLPNADRLFD